MNAILNDIDPMTNDIDPITIEIIGSAFSSIVEEMGETLIKASYSPTIKERRDCSTALFDCEGQTLCQAEHIPLHLGSFLMFIPAIMRRYELQDIRPGDAFIGNDAYDGGGTHLPDIVLAEPVFVEGTLVAWAINTAHHADFIDRGHAHIFQEGLRIPPIRFHRAGELNKDLEQLILFNCQNPRERLSDFRAQMACNRLGVRRMQNLCTKYGVGTVLLASKALQDYAERKTRAGIRRVPDGVYRFADRFDNTELNGVVELSVEITVSGDEMAFHFDSPPQVRGPTNVPYTALLATVYFAVKSLLDPSILPNGGLARPITVTAEKGTMLNCEFPAAVDGRSNPCQCVADLIFGALAQALPTEVPAASMGGMNGFHLLGRRNGQHWIYGEAIGGGGGARPNKDGLSGIQVSMTNTRNIPIEAVEIEYPVTIMAYELVDGSGGEGRHHGGMGIRRAIRVHEECWFRPLGSRYQSNAWGLQGGGEGARARFLVNGSPHSSSTGWMKAGDTFQVYTPGGGGFGLPASGKT